jgi:hypothetical protein
MPPDQKCPELIPLSPGAYDGGGKCAAEDVIPGSGRSVTTPSSLEAQAESRHVVTKATNPDKAAPFFTEANVPIAESHATPAG